jgi:hypothetical protein
VLISSFVEFIRVVAREGKRPEIPKDCPKKLRELIEKCWAQDPTLRPSFEQIAESNIFYRIILDGTYTIFNYTAIMPHHITPRSTQTHTDTLRNEECCFSTDLIKDNEARLFWEKYFLTEVRFFCS